MVVLLNLESPKKTSRPGIESRKTHQNRAPPLQVTLSAAVAAFHGAGGGRVAPFFAELAAAAVRSRSWTMFRVDADSAVRVASGIIGIVRGETVHRCGSHYPGYLVVLASQ